jgi:hypothetical protein
MMAPSANRFGTFCGSYAPPDFSFCQDSRRPFRGDSAAPDPIVTSTSFAPTTPLISGHRWLIYAVVAIAVFLVVAALALI